jgi:two-component system response regulator
MDSIEILLVEDNIYDAELTIHALKQGKLVNDIIHLSDGAEALDFVFRKGKYEGRSSAHPKLILLDIKMPKVTGLEVLKELKANDLTKTIPVVMLTSSNLDPDIQACYDLGVNSYVVKPVEFDDFSKAVAQLGVYWMMLNKQPDK